MTLPLGQGNTGDRAWDPAMARELIAALEQAPGRFDAVAVGPGLGRDACARDALAVLLPYLAEAGPPLVLDADALFWLAEECSLCSGLGAGTVITPHPGEAARLLGTDTARVQADRLGVARTLARDKGCVAVLKGAGTVIAEPGGRAFLSPFAAPNLAVGGSGDVLAGLLAGLLARGLDPLDAAALAVYWHGHAGALLEEDFPLRGNLPRDIADALPRALKEFFDDA
jgi:ADP-dependent NAD(P)H-hydrate dehydratase / NAD(P)H-hydrate epimerase